MRLNVDLRRNVIWYRVMAYLTGVILIILCVLAIMQAFTNDSGLVNVVGTIHGCLYIVYLLVSYPLTRKLRLSPGPTVAVLLAGTIPVMTFIVESHIRHRYIEPALAAAAAPPPPPRPAQPPPAQSMPAQPMPAQPMPDQPMPEPRP